MQFIILENDKHSLELLRDHLSRCRGTLLCFVDECFHKRYIYETWFTLQALDWTTEHILTIISEPQLHDLSGVRDKKIAKDKIYMRARIDLESFVSKFFSGVTWAFGFSFESNGGD